MKDFDNIGVSQIQLDEPTPDRAQMENTINVRNDGIVSHLRRYQGPTAILSIRSVTDRYGVDPGRQLNLFKKPAIATIGTMLPNGQPQVTPVWADYDGTHVLVVTRKGTRKHKNVEHGPTATVTIIDPDDNYRCVEVRGEVEKMPEEGVLECSDRQAQRYWG